MNIKLMIPTLIVINFMAMSGHARNADAPAGSDQAYGTKSPSASPPPASVAQSSRLVQSPLPSSCFDTTPTPIMLKDSMDTAHALEGYTNKAYFSLPSYTYNDVQATKKLGYLLKFLVNRNGIQSASPSMLINLAKTLTPSGSGLTLKQALTAVDEIIKLEIVSLEIDIRAIDTLSATPLYVYAPDISKEQLERYDDLRCQQAQTYNVLRLFQALP